MFLSNTIYPGPEFEFWITNGQIRNTIELPDGSFYPLVAGDSVRVYDMWGNLCGYSELVASTKYADCFGFWHLPVYGQYTSPDTEKLYQPFGLESKERYFILVAGFFVRQEIYVGGMADRHFDDAGPLQLKSAPLGALTYKKEGLDIADFTVMQRFVTMDYDPGLGNEIFPYWGDVDASGDGPDIADITLMISHLWLTLEPFPATEKDVAALVRALPKPKVGYYVKTEGPWSAPVK